MIPTLDTHLKTPHEIGSHIASLIPNLDKSDGWHKGHWAAHHFHFQTGPDPSSHQLKQGLILEVANADKKPQALHTKYGYWKILGSSCGSFEKIFATLQKTLHLKKIEEYKNPHLSLWEIQSWNSQALPHPVRACRKAGEYIPHSKCATAYREFKSNLSNIENLSKVSAGKPPALPKLLSCKSPSPPLASSSHDAPEKKTNDTQAVFPSLTSIYAGKINLAADPQAWPKLPSTKHPSTLSAPSKNSEQTLSPEVSTQLTQTAGPSARQTASSSLDESFPKLPRPPSYMPSTASTPSPCRQSWHATPRHAMRTSPKSQQHETKPSSVPPKTPTNPARDSRKGSFSVRIISSSVVPSQPPMRSQQQHATIPLVAQKQILRRPTSHTPTLTLKPTTSQKNPILLRPETSPQVFNNAIQATLQPPVSEGPTVQKTDTGECSSGGTMAHTHSAGWQPLFHSPIIFNGVQSPEVFR